MGSQAIVDGFSCVCASIDTLEDAVVHAYTCRGESIRQIAVDLGIDRRRATRLLEEAGVSVASRGAGRARPARRVAEPPGFSTVLRRLYEQERLSSKQIAALFEIPERRVRTRLRQAGIAARPRGGLDRADRHKIDVAALAYLHDECALSLLEISERLQAPYQSTLRTAHDAGVAVRFGGNHAESSDGVELISALYEDEAVLETLRRFGIPLVPPGRPVWERFPSPVVLTREALDALYTDCGLSALQIEMITGQAGATIIKALSRAAIARRAPGGRSPFWYRWRTKQESASVSVPGKHSGAEVP